MRAVDLIVKKRDGGTHSPAEIEFLVSGLLDGTIGEEQIAAWLMATLWQGLDDAETFALCEAMVASGDTVDFADLGCVVDKHSTGGVGDKVTIALAPIVAACGVPIAKMSGRGLGHTGGTLDKLESIPGFQIAQSVDEFRRIVAQTNCAVIAQTPTLVPADARLYALRDVTGTVPQLGLIAASVMSKKIAAGADAMVLDVKVGDGAFMRTVEEARALAELMQRLGTAAGRQVVCEISRMDQPLGQAVGNALEVDEAFALLRGCAPADLDELVRGSAATLLSLAGRGDLATCRTQVDRVIDTGAAVRAAEQWVDAQGGDPRAVVDGVCHLDPAPIIRRIEAPAMGVVSRCSALAIGEAAVRLGAGRARKQDPVDHAVGIRVLAKVGDAVAAGDLVAEVLARDTATADAAVAEVTAAYRFGSKSVNAPAVVVETIGTL